MGAVQRELEAIGDELLATGAMIQASVDRRDAGHFVTSDYGFAVGWDHWRTGGAWTDSLAWSRRYLYEVGASIWLGPDLVRRVGTAHPAIDDLITTRDGGFRVDSPAGRDRRRVERALADIVPGLAPPDPSIPIPMPVV